MQQYSLEEIKRFIENEPLESKIYIGVDSEVYRKNKRSYVNFYSVVVVHKKGYNGCKVFGWKTTEHDYTKDKRKPLYRLMQEVYKTSALFLELRESIGERPVEVHLDLNPDKKYVSNLVVDQAIGYIKGTCGIIPLIKPNSWAATSVADKCLRDKRKNVALEVAA